MCAQSVKTFCEMQTLNKGKVCSLEVKRESNVFMLKFVALCSLLVIFHSHICIFKNLRMALAHDIRDG